MDETNTDSPYLTTKEVAALIRRTPHALRQMRYRGLAPKGTRVGREVLWLRSDVDAWLRQKSETDPLAQRAAA